MKMKKLLAASIAACMVLPLAACGSDSGSSGSSSSSGSSDSGEVTKVTLKVWTPQEDQVAEYGNWLGKMESNFEAAHPEYDITWTNEVCQEGDIGDKVTQDPTKSADVFLFANDQIGKLLDANAIAELGGSTVEEIKATNSEIVVNSVTHDGAVYGVPFTTNTWFMYYNKSMFNEEDVKTFEGMLGKGVVTFPLTNSWYVPAWFLADGGTMFGPNGDDASDGVNFDLPDVTKYLVSLVANPNFQTDADGSGFQAFVNKKVGCLFSGSWDYQNLKDALGDDLGAVQLPTYEIDGEAKQLKAFAGSKAIGVNANAANPKAAVEFAAYLGSEEAQKAHWEDRMIIPTNTELLKDPAIGDDMLVKAQNDTVDNTSVIQPTITAMGNFWTIGENFGKAIVNGDVTEANAVEQTTKFQEQLDTLKE